MSVKIHNRNPLLVSLFWKSFERFGTQGIQFLVSIIMTRLLLPEQYGVISIVLVLISFANILVQTGFTNALIQKKEVTELDYSSVLIFTIVISIILYLIFFLFAPLIAMLMKHGELSLIIRVLSVIIIIGSVNSIQIVIVSRRMEFKKLFFCSLFGIIIGGVLGIALAVLGCGVWSLVVQQIVSSFITVIVLGFSLKWTPCVQFSISKTRKILKFGSHILFASLIDNLYSTYFNFLVLRNFSSKTLGLYSRGVQISSIFAVNIDNAMQTVLLPVLSAKQDNVKLLKDMTRRIIGVSTFVLMPVMFGLASIANPLVVLILGEKWIGCVPFLQIACFGFAFNSIHTANLSAINALGLSKKILQLCILKNILAFSTVAIMVKYGIYTMYVSQTVLSILLVLINWYPNKKNLNFSFLELLNDIFLNLFSSVFMLCFIYPINFLRLSSALNILIQLVVAIVIYIILAVLFKNKNLLVCSDICRKMLKQQNVES